MKRGQGFGINTIVLIVLSLVVLVIIIMVVRQQITKGTSQYEDIGSKAELNPDKCENILLGQSCKPTNECTSENGYRTVGKLNCEGNTVCCQRVG